jgi:hypothetical protein
MHCSAITWLAFLLGVSGMMSVQRIHAQDKEGWLTNFKDTTDGALDLSRFLLEKNGFVPMLSVVTEPALGGFGLALAPIFLLQKPRGLGGRYNPPDVTAAFAMYTANESWAVGGGRSGTIVPWGLRYRAFAAYADVNMDFYRELPVLGEQTISMRMRALPVLLQAIKQVGNSPWYGGLKYVWADVISSAQEPRFSDVFEPIELEGRTSMLGGVVEFDRRDNVFSPKRGVRAHLDYNVSAEGLGSDYDYQSAELFVHGWFPVKQGWVSGLRLQVDQVWGEPTFYQLPFIELRGIPFFRYQGEIAAVVETEQRIHLWHRWSTVAFVGAGRTADSWDDLSGGDTPYNLGFGPRYQLAKAFDLDLGLDVAWGPDSFGWYIVFGNAWLR